MSKFSARGKDTEFVVLLPRVAASREYASILTMEVKKRHDVLIDGRRMVLSGDSFADQLMWNLAEKNPRSVTVIGGNDEWMERIRTAAGKNDVGIVIKPLSEG